MIHPPNQLPASVQPTGQPLERLLLRLSATLGVISYLILHAYHNTLDFDIWAKLALGAHFWHTGAILAKDVFAFTPTLDPYIDHEWGTGVFYYALLAVCGPLGLYFYKILGGLVVIALCLIIGRRAGASWPALLLLAIPGALTISIGFFVVIRSESVTYLCFALTLLLLEELRRGRRFAAFIIPAIVALWVNLHGGFVAGLALIGVYTLCGLISGEQRKLLLSVALISAAATLLNPWGARYWGHIYSALALERPDMGEWKPLLWLHWDAFNGFRLLAPITILVVAAGFRGVPAGARSWPLLIMLALTFYMGFAVRRHTTFLGITALAAAGPYLDAAFRSCESKLRPGPQLLRLLAAQKVWIIFGLYAALGIYSLLALLPRIYFHPLAQAGLYPVREIDILAYSQLQGNLAAPFGWGSYAGWRLHPRIKVAYDGRYEAVYPPATYELCANFEKKRGENWNRLLERHRVDFVILDFEHTLLRPEDLQPFGFVTVFTSEYNTALLVHRNRLDEFRRSLQGFDGGTIQPLDAAIAANWFRSRQAVDANPQGTR